MITGTDKIFIAGNVARFGICFNHIRVSATSLIDPEGNMIEYLTCGVEGLMIKDLDLSKATGFYAGRYRPERYNEYK